MLNSTLLISFLKIILTNSFQLIFEHAKLIIDFKCLSILNEFDPGQI